MATENVKAFLEKAKTNEGLKAKFKGLPSDEKGMVRKIVEIGKNAGYHFSEQDWYDMHKSALQSGELKEEDLAKVSGGTIFTITTPIVINTIVTATVTVCRK